MFEALAHWYLQRREIKNNEALIGRTPNSSGPGGLSQLMPHDYGREGSNIRNLMVRVVAIKNGFLVSTDSATFEEIEFCIGVEQVATAITKQSAVFVLEK